MCGYTTFRRDSIQHHHGMLYYFFDYYVWNCVFPWKTRQCCTDLFFYCMDVVFNFANVFIGTLGVIFDIMFFCKMGSNGLNCSSPITILILNPWLLYNWMTVWRYFKVIFVVMIWTYSTIPNLILLDTVIKNASPLTNI